MLSMGFVILETVTSILKQNLGLSPALSGLAPADPVTEEELHHRSGGRGEGPGVVLEFRTCPGHSLSSVYALFSMPH